MTEPVSWLATSLADRYRIERELGQGGMATVYLAHDVRHDRKVAIKVLKPELAAVLGAERFVVEIKTTAALSHPHILPLFDSGAVPLNLPEVGRARGPALLYYVMPYIEGETIREKLNRETQFGVEEAVRIAREVADALDYAHRHGVIHRDIKPENILLHDGRAMVMDFGIALAVSAAAGGRMTETGLSLGTPHYMSPEQATAEKELTARSDIYSLASVLYEMLTGEPPHTAGSAQAVIMKIITDTARPVQELRKNVPPNVAAAVATALEKLPADRFATASEFSLALQGKGDLSVLDRYGRTGAPGDAGTMLRRSRTREFASWTLAGVLAVAFGWSILRPRPTTDSSVVQFIISTPDSERPAIGGSYTAAISPDGRVVLYSANRAAGGTSLQAFRTDRLDSRAIPGTMDATQPIFSPDGQSVAFESSGKLRKMRIDGGTPTVISDGRTNDGAAWTSNDEIVLGADAGFHGLSHVSANGGRLAEFTKPDTSKGETEHWYPVALDDGTTIIFAIVGGSLGTAELAITSLPTGKVTRLGVSGFRPLAVIDGWLLYVQVDGTVNAVKLDARARRVVGTPIPVYGPVHASGGNGEIFISRSGALVAGRAAFTSQMVWEGRDGTVRPVVREARGFAPPRLSHDERRIAVAISDGQSSDIWIYDLATSTTTRLTSVQSATSPIWSIDDKRVLYFADGPDGKPAIWAQDVDGSSAPEKKGDVNGIPGSLAISPDGNSLLYHAWNRSSYDIFELRLDSAEASHVYLGTPEMELLPDFSPDGRSVLVIAGQMGSREIFARSYPTPGARLQISAGSSGFARWSADGRQVFYQSGTALLAARLATGPSGLRVEARDTILARSKLAEGGGFEPTRDGTRFLGLVPVGGNLELVVSPNWIVELREKLAARKK